MMKKCFFFTLLSVCLLGFVNQADAQSKAECFKMQTGRAVKEIPVEKTFPAERGNNELKLFDGIDAVYGLSVTMDIQRLAENYLVRVVLIDKEGHKHLVAESYREIAPEEKNLQLTDYCEETALLDGVNPVSLQVITDNADVALHSLSVATEGSRENTFRPEEFHMQTACLHRQQVEEKLSQIKNYNRSNNSLWYADVTSIALEPFERRLELLGCPDDVSTGAIEFYSGGIYEFSHGYSAEAGFLWPYEDYEYVEDFDWRNRHGGNWITPVKDQYPTSGCSAYASVAVLESLTQLYYNQIDSTIDLAEGDILNGYHNLFLSGIDSVKRVVEYFSTYGVNDQLSNNYIGNTLYPSDHRKLHVLPSGYGVCPINMDSIKTYLREKGPMVSGYCWGNPKNGVRDGHAMALIGYGKIREGMTIGYHNDPQDIDDIGNIVIMSGDPRIGQYYLIFKDSYGDNVHNIAPYSYILFDDLYDIIDPYYFKLPIHVTTYDQETGVVVKEYSEADIICDDRDHDGFYFWGIGPRPSNFPQNVLPEKDGDDGNPLYGPIYPNGWILNLDPDSQEIADAWDVFNSNSYETHCYSHCILEGNYSIESHGPVYFHNGATLTLENGSTLLIKNTIYNANIIMEAGSTLRICDGGSIILKEGISFNPPVGAIVEIENGSIEPFVE